MAGWLLPALAYVVLVGIAGITTKVALRTIEWQQIVYWVPVVYVVLGDPLPRLPQAMVMGTGGGRAIVTAFAAAGGLICFFYALSKGDASVVVHDLGLPGDRAGRRSACSSRRASPSRG